MPNAGAGGAGERRRATIAVAAGVAALAAAATLPGAIDLPLWQDEVASARVLLEVTPAGVVEHVARTESTPPGWYLLAWLGREAGISIEGLRFLSVALAAALAGLTVVYARRFLPLWTAGLAGVLTALAWQTVVHGSELRAYALLALLTLVFALLARARRRASLGSGGWLRSRPARRPAPTRTTSSCSPRSPGSSGSPSSASCAPWPSASGRRSSSARPRCSPGSPASLDQVGAERFGWIDAFDPVKFASLPSALFWDPGTMYAELGADPGLWEAARAGGDPRARPRRLRRSRAARARPPASARCSSLVPVGVSGIAWLAGLRIVTGRNLIGVTAFAAIALAAVLAAAPAPGGVRGRRRRPRARGLRLRPHARWPSGRLRPGRGRARRGGLGAGRPDPRRRLAPDFRSPLEWYLPGDVTLARGRAAGDLRRAVGRDGRARAGATCSTSPQPASRDDVGTVEVARVAWNGTLAAEADAAEGATSTPRPAPAAWPARGPRHLAGSPRPASVWQTVRRLRST